MPPLGTDILAFGLEADVAGVKEGSKAAIGFRVGKEHFGAAFGATGTPEASIERFYFDSISLIIS